MKKRKIKDFMLVADAFGPMPVWSLMHPKKENQDAYLLPIWRKKKPLWLKTLIKFEKKHPSWECYVTGEIEWEFNKAIKDRVVVNLKIKYVVLYLYNDEF